MSIKTVSATTARKTLAGLLDEVATFGTHVVIIHRGRAKAVLILPEELAAWEAAVSPPAKASTAVVTGRSAEEGAI